jgi:uncharacterized protein (DUF4415 family)
MVMIVWDEPKRQSNLAKHGLDFADLDEELFLGALVVPARQGRFRAMGRFADGMIAVFAVLGSEGVSVISTRAASKGHSMRKKHLSDAEDAVIQRQIARDPDNPEWTEEDFAEAKPFAEAFPALAEKMRKNVGGRPKLAAPKVAVSLRLDRDVVEKFRATGAGWQTRINDVLRRAVEG